VKVTLRRGPNVLGVSTGADLDTKNLPPVEAAELRRLVDEAQIPEASTEPTVLVPDQREITIRVDAEDQQLKVTFAEGLCPPAIDTLLEYLDRHGKIIPNS
jgi:hypothetical protein